MQHSYSRPSQTPQPVQQNSLSQADIVGNTVVAIILLAFPVCIVLGTYFYKKYYRAYRSAVRLQHIEYLEKLWRLSAKQ